MRQIQLLWLAGIPLALWVAFISPWASSLHVLYVCFLPLIWAALAGGLASASIAMALLNLGIMVAVSLTGLQTYSSADLQLLLCIMALAGLALGAVVSDLRSENRERKAAEESLAKLNAELERRVWAEGTVNQGATFHFTLPPRQ